MRGTLKKIRKILLWILVCFTGLFLLLFVLVQIPAIQNYIVQKLTGSISSKTHTTVRIGRVGLSFPRSVYLSDVFLDDEQKDTLLAAGRIEVGLDMLKLLSGEINIDGVQIEDLTARISRGETPRFNFSFLEEAFASSDSAIKPPEAEAEKKNIAIRSVQLRNVNFLYDDRYAGIRADAAFSVLKVSTENLDFDSLLFGLDDVVLKDAAITLTVTKESQPEDSTVGKSPGFSANHILLDEVSFHYESMTDSQRISFQSGNLALSKSSADLSAGIFNVKEIDAHRTIVLINAGKKVKVVTDPLVSEKGEPLLVKVEDIDLREIAFSYDDASAPLSVNAFDPAHIRITGFNFGAKDVQFAGPELDARANIQTFSFAEANGFELEKFSSRITFTKRELVLEDLDARTARSVIRSDIRITYPSFELLKDSLQSVYVDAEFADVKIDPYDIRWFAPQLAGKPFLASGSRAVSVRGRLHGQVSDLKSEQLVIQAGESTRLQAAFRVTGLPDSKRANFSVPHFQLHSTRLDLESNLDTLIPPSIRLPEEISADGSFKGTVEDFLAEIDLETSSGSLQAKVEMKPGEKYTAEISAVDMEAGYLLKMEEMFGEFSFSARINGQGLNSETLQADAVLQVESAVVNKYAYTNLDLTGSVSDQQFTGKITMDDPNLSFAFDGSAGWKKGAEQYKFLFDLKGANLLALHLTEEPLRIAARLEADIKGNTTDNLNGKAGITKIVLVKEDKTYTIDSVLFASINENGRSEMSLSSAVIGMKFSGTIAPGKLVAEMNRHLSRYFSLGGPVQVQTEKNNFSFEIVLHNHPVIRGIFLPELTEFDPGSITGTFDSEKQLFEVKAALNNMQYGTTHMQEAVLDIRSDPEALNYSFSAMEISNSQIALHLPVVRGRVANNKAAVSLSIGREEASPRLALQAEVTAREDKSMQVKFGKEMVLAGSAWSIPVESEILIREKSEPVIRFRMEREGEMTSVDMRDSMLELKFGNFELLHVSRLVQKDTALAEGKLNGSFILRAGGKFNADLSLADLRIRTHPVGQLSLQAENATASDIRVSLRVTGDNDLQASGNIRTGKQESTLDGELVIRQLRMETVEGFSMGALTQSAGKISGDIRIQGAMSKPKLEGEIHFTDVVTTPQATGNPLSLKNETLLLKNSEIRFNAFTLRDKNDHTAVINGSIDLNNSSSPAFDLDLATDRFLLMNTTSSVNKIYYGTLLIGSKITVNGTPDAPRIKASIRMEKGSYFTFAIPESQLSTDRGEGVVEFSRKGLDSILVAEEKGAGSRTSYRNVELNSEIIVDKDATLRLLLDPASGDSLVVRGDAALSLTMDASGKISLAGRYELVDGSYLVSLQDLIRKHFVIEKGSTLTWSGDPLEGEVHMRAKYAVRASPYDLVASQLSGFGSDQQNAYRERLPFEVILKLDGPMLRPDIHFEIQLAPESRGAMGGVVNSKLNLLNLDESELNKQVFALLVLNRFIQEDPLASSGGGAENVARQSVSRFLTQQLNKWSSEHISGVELNLDVQSYDDYTAGGTRGRTEVDIGIKRQFNDRFSVQVGGGVDVEGSRSKQSNLGDLTGDILIEYKLTEDGRYRLKGFRRNEYEGLIEGQLTETGAGVLYTRDFDTWKDLLKKPDEEDR